MNVYTIDLFHQGSPETIAIFLIESGDNLVLVESGPMSDLPQALDGIRKLGFDPQAINHLLLTHIHFDHAGASGWWAEQGTQIYVHPNGARHLIDPARLNASARMVYGDDLDRLYGEFTPIAAEKLTVLEDNDVVEIGDLRFTALDTPGHARHHHAYQIGTTVFAGDVAGMRVPDSPFIGLAGAPPQFDPDELEQSITRLQQVEIETLYLTHFGAVTEVADHLERYREIVWGSTELIRAHMRNGGDRKQLHHAFYHYNHNRALLNGLTDAQWAHNKVVIPFNISADGVALYWQKRLKREQEEKLNEA